MNSKEMHVASEGRESQAMGRRQRSCLESSEKEAAAEDKVREEWILTSSDTQCINMVCFFFFLVFYHKITIFLGGHELNGGPPKDTNTS